MEMDKMLLMKFSFVAVSTYGFLIILRVGFHVADGCVLLYFFENYSTLVPYSIKISATLINCGGLHLEMSLLFSVKAS